MNLVLAILRARQMWGGQARRCPACARRSATPSAPTTARPPTRSRRGPGRSSRPWRRRAGIPLRSPASLPACSARARPATDARGSGRRCSRSPPPRWCPGSPRPRMRSTRMLHALDGGFVPAGPERLAAARPGQRAADRAQLLLRRSRGPSRPGWPGRPARRWPTRCSSATWPTPASTRGRWACRSGAPPRCAPPATTSPRCSRCSASARSGTRRHAAVSGLRAGRRSASSAGRASTSPSGSAASSGTRSRTWSPCSTTRCGWWPGWTSRTSRITSAPTHGPTWPVHGDERRATTRIFGSKPGAYGAGLLPLIDARNWRDDADLAEVYTAWGGFAYGRDLDGREARADMETAYRRIAVAAQEHRHPRARHRRLRRLLPVPRRHGRDRPGADRPRPARLHRRLHPPGRRPHPVAGRGDRAGIPGPGRQPALGRGDEASRLQGRVRAGRHRGLPVRLRRHRRRGRGLDVRQAHPGLRARRVDAGSSSSSPTRGRCTASPNGSWRPPTASCGTPRTRRRSPRSARSTWKPKATWKTGSSHPRHAADQGGRTRRDTAADQLAYPLHGLVAAASVRRT